MDWGLCVVIIAVVSIPTWTEHSRAQGPLSRPGPRLGSLEADSETEASTQVFLRKWPWDQARGQGDKEAGLGRGKLHREAREQPQTAPWEFWNQRGLLESSAWAFKLLDPSVTESALPWERVNPGERWVSMAETIPGGADG